jgi:hypothetical protein
VIKVMNEHREGGQGQVFWSARTKGCPEPFNWSIINVLYIYSNLSMQGRFKMEYRLLTIVRYDGITIGITTHPLNLNLTCMQG